MPIPPARVDPGFASIGAQTKSGRDNLADYAKWTFRVRLIPGIDFGAPFRRHGKTNLVIVPGLERI